MTERICIEELHAKDDIMNALKTLGSNLFDQRINTENKLEMLADKYSNYANTIVIKYDDQIIGLCAYYSNDRVQRKAFISMLVIEGCKQHKGYGEMLLSEVIRRCINQNMKQLMLEVSNNNIRAIQIYEKIGFRLLEKRNDSLIYMQDICQTS